MIIYPSGKFIIVRNLNDPADSFIYRGHGHTTTVAKFSPNGFWVASADVSGKVRVWAWDNPEHLTKLETSVFAARVYDLDWDSDADNEETTVGTGIWEKGEWVPTKTKKDKWWEKESAERVAERDTSLYSKAKKNNKNVTM